jgi:ribonuclease E
LLPVYAGPTPADPFGGRAFDIFDVMDQVERQAESTPMPRTAPATEIVNVSEPEPEALTADAQAGSQQIVQPLADEAGTVVSQPADETTEIPIATASEPVDEESPPETKVEIHHVESAEMATSAEGAAPTASAPTPPDVIPVDPILATPIPANYVAAQPVAPEPPPAEPAIRPILVGSGSEPPVERKRGWWRR